jgi:hypothetical protein
MRAGNDLARLRLKPANQTHRRDAEGAEKEQLKTLRSLRLGGEKSCRIWTIIFAI